LEVQVPKFSPARQWTDSKARAFRKQLSQPNILALLCACVCSMIGVWWARKR
jgi:hypothetical protein